MSLYINDPDEYDIDYDDGTEESGQSQDWNAEPGDANWVGTMGNDDDDDD